MTRRKLILLSLLFSLPVILFVLQQYYQHSPNLRPTGFTMDENVLYMSYAHQYLDQDHFSLFYSNPFDGDPQSPKIYFQPVNFIFAGLIKLGADPGLSFTIFGLIMAFLCILLGIKILQLLLPGYKQQSFIATLFTWGGGLTAIAGLMGSSFLSGYQTQHWIDGIYQADPANGWWGLNWGRTLFIPLEAYYHLLFLLNIYFILKQKWFAAAVAALYLSLSHPFTGIEYLLIMNVWLLFEKLLYRNKSIPYWYWGAIFAVTIFHCWYYLIYLNSFQEHKQIFSQYSVGWTYSLLIVIPAYCLVAALSFLNVFISKPIKRILSIPHQRLFFCWAIIAFLLSKHEWFIKPMQPIHFTRGYVWSGFFLFSLPALIWLINYLQQSGKRKWLLYGFTFIFLSDNILWTVNLLKDTNNIEWEGHITKDTQQVLKFLQLNASNKDLLVGNATLVNYLTNVYTDTNAWVSHPFNTPKREERISQMHFFLQTGTKPQEWKNRRILIVLNKKTGSMKLLPSLLNNKLFENDSYIIFTP
jgi:hypothetical protein